MADGHRSAVTHIEKPRFALTQGPVWLGSTRHRVLSGTPDVSGKADAAITVTIDRQWRKLDEAVTAMGLTKVLSVNAERSAKQPEVRHRR